MLGLPRMLAPAGSPIHTREMASWLVDLLARHDRREHLCEAVRSRFGSGYCFLFSTGRAAMSLLFSALRELNPDPRRNEVVVPAYTCYSVPSSVLRAGLHVRVCDVDPNTLSFDLEQLRTVAFDRVLAVVSGNLYGYPDDLPEIERIADKHGVFLADDAAQSLNARIGNRFSGTFGTAGLYSLDKGKNVTAIQGGLIVTDSDALADIVRAKQGSLTTGSIADSFKEYVKLLTYFLFLPPALYWIPGNLPFLGLGETRYEEDYPVGLLKPGLAPVACAQLGRLDTITDQRREVASWYQELLPRHTTIRHLETIEEAQPVYLRYPVRILDSRLRRRFLRSCSRLGVTGSYPAPIAEIPEIRGRLLIHNDRYENALMVSRQIATLPTHQFVTRRDAEAIGQTLGRLAAEEDTARAKSCESMI